MPTYRLRNYCTRKQRKQTKTIFSPKATKYINPRRESEKRDIYIRNDDRKSQKCTKNTRRMTTRMYVLVRTCNATPCFHCLLVVYFAKYRVPRHFRYITTPPLPAPPPRQPKRKHEPSQKKITPRVDHDISHFLSTQQLVAHRVKAFYHIDGKLEKNGFVDVAATITTNPRATVYRNRRRVQHIHDYKKQTLPDPISLLTKT